MGRTLLEGLPVLGQCRWPNAALVNRDGSRRVAANFANTENKKIPLVDSSISQIPQISKRNKRSLTPTRALKKTRASVTEFGKRE
jgi:hypothetical protein